MIATERLLLRPWRDEDMAAHRALVTDPRVIRTLGGPPAPAMSQEVIARQRALLAAHGYCFWAAELGADGRFAGWCGITPGRPPIEGETEIGWALAPTFWGYGLAREAASAVLDWAWANTDRPRILAITAEVNVRSRTLMESLRMRRVAGGEFDHPDLAPGHALRPHVTYAIDRPA